MNPILRLGLFGSLALSALTVGCAGSWQEEPETPRPAWDEEAPVGTSTAAPPYASPQGQAVATQNPEDVEETDPSAMATFQPALQPYGTWVDDPVYGTVWVPNPDEVGSNFQPYVSNGHWTESDQGYYWASDYQWGWATFHYGRWVWVDNGGWVWIPGARYSPAWVEWRYGNGYVGWGPMYPHYCWHGYSTVWINAGPTPYVFAPSGSFYHPHPSSVIVAPSAAPGMVSSTQPYAPKPLVGQKPFVGPDAKSAGIPTSAVPKAPNTPANHFAWSPAPGSKIAPTSGIAMKPKPGTAYPGYAPTPKTPMGVSPGGSKSLGTSPGYDPPVASGPKYNGPTATHPPTYGSSPTYKPASPSYGGGYKPTAPSYGGGYKPTAPSYGGGSAYKPPAPSYGGGGGYKPAPTYSPPSYKPSSPSYSPAPKSYSPPSFSAPKVSKPSYSAPAPHVGGGKHK